MKKGRPENNRTDTPEYPTPIVAQPHVEMLPPDPFVLPVWHAEGAENNDVDAGAEIILHWQPIAMSEYLIPY